MNKRYLFSIVLILIAIVFIVLFSSVGRPARSVNQVQNTTPVQQASQNQEQILTDYLNQNISAISPEKEILGGTFYITNVTLLSQDTATVRYEEGHNAYTAKFNYMINNGLVSVTNFAIVPDDIAVTNQASFDTDGTLVDGPRMFNNWSFIYEEEGGAPIKVKLIFNEQSLCKSGANEIECFALSTDQYVKSGDHVRIEGKLGDEALTVSRLTKL